MTDLDRLDAPTPTTSAGRFVVAYVRQRLGDEAGDATAVHVADAEEEARDAAVRERDELREAADFVDDAAIEYLAAVTAYLDPENQFTDSRQHAMTEMRDVLVDSIHRLRALHREAGA